MSLKDQLIKLGSERKDLRPHIRPVLSTLSKNSSRQGWAGRKRNVKERVFPVSDEFNPQKVVAALLAEMKKLV